MRWLLLGITLVGCGDDEVPGDELGQVRFCLGTDADLDPSVVGSTRRWDVSGTVVAIDAAGPPSGGAPFTCIPNTGRTLDVQDATDHVWRVGWYATSGNADRTPATSAQVGDTVDVTFLHLDDFADDSALVVSDADGLLLAGEEGYGERIDEVDAGLLRGLAVERGDTDPSLFYQTDCGRFTPQLLDFAAGGRSLSLSTWEEGELPVGGVSLQLRNVGAWAYVGEVSCTDSWGPMPWLAWR